MNALPALGGREIGPVGTAARLLGGVLAVTLPIALHGLSWLEAGIALVALPAVAGLAAPLIAAGYRRARPGHAPSAICSWPSCALIAVMVAANAAIVAPTTADGNVTLWVWLGASMLLAAVRGDGGCEVLAISNAITGRHDRIGCVIYGPIDAAEARRAPPRQ